MKVVSNTSPIYYLLLINQIHLLPALFSEVVVPKAVSSELAAESAPSLLRKWIAQPPAWLRIESVIIGSDPLLSRLHADEQQAIMLAQQISADLIILDEIAARQAAIEHSLNVTGLLGILDEAATRGIVDLGAVIERLSQTSFRVSPHLLKMLLDRHFR